MNFEKGGEAIDSVQMNDWISLFIFKFNKIRVGLGKEEYAELYDEKTLLKMPFNAIVNVGYLLVAIYWFYTIRKLPKGSHKPFFYLMAIQSFCYGFIQFFRIITQHHVFGVMDQWVTLPFFSTVIAWSHQLLSFPRERFLLLRTLLILTLSILSYLGVLFLDLVFYLEWFSFSLGVHIILCVGMTFFLIHNARYSKKILVPFFFALISCCGFVFLKVLDHWLALHYCAAFCTLTGHFWSKVCDFMQIHFVLSFFRAYYSQVNNSQKKAS
eukprot:TRINITY_DN4908_c0_g1_i1.p1 TRINITY_DN4908_c0_g1~~TRINITY_DN4908_c0_g1_i1.p1  ORF type:complete len:269 (-),score=40.13 TRINITY_DN4908_c0_g1_i1:84-890(-)